MHGPEALWPASRIGLAAEATRPFAQRAPVRDTSPVAYDEDLADRLPAETAALVAEPRAERFEMRGRSMDGWLRVDTDGLGEELAGWVARGVCYARSLPPKR